MSAGKVDVDLGMALTAAFFGVPGFVAFAYATSWYAAVALFLVLFANNLSERSQHRAASKDTQP